MPGDAFFFAGVGRNRLTLLSLGWSGGSSAAIQSQRAAFDSSSVAIGALATDH
jgi:hypothetical protein